MIPKGSLLLASIRYNLRDTQLGGKCISQISSWEKAEGGLEHMGGPHILGLRSGETSCEAVTRRLILEEQKLEPRNDRGLAQFQII